MRDYMNLHEGTLKTYYPNKGFGFVSPDCSYIDQDIFFHISNVKNIENQLFRPNLKLWFEIETNNRGDYICKAWAFREEIPEEYLCILERKEANKRAREAARQLKINGTPEEHKEREQLAKRFKYLNLCPEPTDAEKNIRSLQITSDLYKTLQEEMRPVKTTYFYRSNVYREYTRHYCLQRDSRCYITRRGRLFSRTVDDTTYDKQTRYVCTPTFDDMCRGILRDYGSEVIKVCSVEE